MKTKITTKIIALLILQLAIGPIAKSQVNSDSTMKIDSICWQKSITYANQEIYTLDNVPPRKETKIDWLASGILTGFFTGYFIAQHKFQMNTIWSEQSDFRFMEDGKLALYADKAGHFYGTYLFSYASREAFHIAGLNWELSNILGTAMGLSYTTYVEILDGYGENWGFSMSDFYADIAGAAFFIGQHYWPFLQNFTPKFMYFPPEWHGEHSRKEAETFIDNYSAQTQFISVNVHNMLPDHMKDYWPKWLELSFGYGARSLCDPRSGCEDYGSQPHYDGDYLLLYGDPKYIIALDYNFREILPEGPPVWNWFVQSLNFFKLPSPAIEFGAETRFSLLYPFRF